MGGSDEPSNIMSLTIEEHADAHRILYEEHGLLEDFLAWKGLSGQMGKEEILKEIYAANARNMVEKRNRNGDWAPWNAGKTGIYSEESLEKMRKPKSEEHKENLRKPKKITDNMGIYERTDAIKKKTGEATKLRSTDPDYRKKLSDSQKNSRSVCCNCGMESNKANITRHEKICKSRQPI
jgi:hypothetical protein